MADVAQKIITGNNIKSKDAVTVCSTSGKSFKYKTDGVTNNTMASNADTRLDPRFDDPDFKVIVTP